MPDMNSTLRRIEAGAIIQIGDGVTTYDLKVYEPGTLEIEEGWYEPLEFTDRGAQQTPYEGDERPSTIRIQAKYTGRHNAADLSKHVSQRDTTTGLMKLFTITIKDPDVKGGATGQQRQFTSCWLARGAIFRAGQRFDTADIEFRSKLVQPTTATY